MRPDAWVSAPGKLLLFGEHAAVYGHPAVGTELDRRLDIRVDATASTADEGAGLVLRLPDGGTEQMTSFAHHARAVFARHGISRVPVEITLRSTLPVASGFGSSAAFCTALARWALRDEAVEDDPPNPPGSERGGVSAGSGPVSTDIVWALAHDLEHAFHGTPSGIDTGIASWGGTCAFSFDAAGQLPSVKQLSVNLPPLVAGSIPRRSTTAELVAGVRRRRDEDPERVNPMLAGLGAIAVSAIEADTWDAGELGRLADAAQDLLASLGVSTPQLENLLAAGRQAGATGGKLSGAGGGGAFFLVAPSMGDAERIHAKLEALLPPDGLLIVVG